MQVLIGGYTAHDSKGIYQLNLSGKEETAHLSELKNIININGPTYFQIDKQLLFAINKANGQKGGISVYKLENNHYSETDHYLTPGSSPAYVGVDSKKQLIYTANYHTGLLAIFKYNLSGKLTLVDSVTHTAEDLGPRPEQQDGAHPHFFDETPKGNLVSCDLGNDCIDFYALNQNQKIKHLAKYHNEAGFGTRHIVFAKDGNYFYVVGELSSRINVVKFNEQNWSFKSIATYSTIPEGWNQHNGAAAVRISNDGKYIYVSNRGHNSIAVFAVNDDHTLKLIQRVSTFGDFPRDFNWDSSQHYVVVANQNSNNATLYLRNQDSGCLTPIQKEIFVPEGTCVQFIK